MATSEKQLALQSLDDNSSREKDAAEVALPPFIVGDEDLEATYGVNEKALLRKLDFKLLPAVTLLYLLSFLDRSNGTHKSSLAGIRYG